jgi:Leucine-rich repeat (LRR) protein
MHLEMSVNPLGEHELGARDNGIRDITELITELSALTAEGIMSSGSASVLTPYESLDLSNNRMTRLSLRQPLPALATLLCAGNLIEAIDMVAATRGKNNTDQEPRKTLPALQTLSLADNVIASFTDILQLAAACPMLSMLNLMGNPVTSK